MTREELDSKKKLILEFTASKTYRPMTVKEMGVVLQVPSKQKKDLRKVVEELSGEGKLQVNSKGRIKLMPDNIKTGKYMGTQRDFGFVRIEGEEEDIYIAGGHTKGAVDGDTVRVAVEEKRNGRRREGIVTEIVERGNGVIVGTYSKSKNFGFVIADNQKCGKDIYIPKACGRGAVTGHKVVVEITDYGSGDRNPEGRVIEIIGHINDPGVDIKSIIKAYGLPEEYPDAVMEQVEKTEDTVSEAEKEGRTDYRDLQTVTIDGEDAKDLDDAITLSKEGNIYRLGVHIADVSYYVRENSPLDKEALKRGTSVYLVDRVIPMLPHKLSNGICSLNQGEDRLALSCVMDINQSGEIISHKIEESVINVDRRMSYTSVNKIIELDDKEEQQKYNEFIPMFALMYEVAAILRKRRFKRGSVDFDFPESKIILDEKGKPLEIKEYERNNAHRIIEEFMLAANQTVAEEYFWQELPFVYRVHDTPDSEKILQLGIFINNFGYTLKTGANDEIHPKEIQKLLNNVKGKPEEALISKLALRSMRQAKYAINCGGHFGLAMKYYCHFTSPIRRYPDLQIHRIIKENIHGRLEDGRISHYNKILPEVAEASSMLERRADDSEREVEKLKKAEYMEQFIGESFEGMVSGVTSWGMYVELPNTVEGMVKVADIPGDYYYFDEEHYCMTGEHTGKNYKLGDKIKVTVAAVDRTIKTIDFIIAEDEEEGGETARLDKKKPKKARKDNKAKDKNTDRTAAKELKSKELKNKELVSKKAANKEKAGQEKILKIKETNTKEDMEINQLKKEKKLIPLFAAGKVKKRKHISGTRKKKKHDKGLKTIFVSPLDKSMRKLIRKKPVINVSVAPRQAVRINTGNVIKDVARISIGKGTTRKPAKVQSIKRSGKMASGRAGRRPLYSAKKKAVPGKVLVNRRRIIASKKRKSSNNN
ncbi:MAG: ribonuclease R [Lachnospiraceae bacterium]|nr:ribonuclease R [Lachnospiraceae bacterium]